MTEGFSFRIVVAVTYNLEKDKFLVLKRAESMEVFPGSWEFPSGKVEDEEPRKAALRELKEETGLVGQVMKEGEVFEVETEYGVFRVHPFLVTVDEEYIELDPEHTEYRWVSIAEIQDLETVKGLEKDLENVGVLNG